MNLKRLFAVWGGMFILCAGLGFIPEPQGVFGNVLTIVSLLFFLPPVMLLRRGDGDTVKLVRNLSALSLGLTLLTLILNFLLAFHSDWIGNVLHVVLVIVSTPMIASGSWVLSLFLWACLLLAAARNAR